MYLQIMEQVKLRITVEDWTPGFQLPSIRELAIAAKVSVITVKRAYQELENEGVIVTRQGRGSFVAEIDGLGRQLREAELDEVLLHALEVTASLGLDVTAVHARLEELTSAPEESKGEGK
jgi:GntR family transcriptional regulator